jgi:hypothetical protein
MKKNLKTEKEKKEIDDELHRLWETVESVKEKLFTINKTIQAEAPSSKQQIDERNILETQLTAISKEIKLLRARYKNFLNM